jgi:hypothetical protein
MRLNRNCAVLAGCTAFLAAALLSAQTVSVHQAQGLLHGFLVLRTMDGAVIANGELIQTAQGDRVTSQTTFHFNDGSLHEETVVFSQQGTFRLLKDHLVQRGPAFKRQIETSFDASSGDFSARYTDEDGKSKSVSERVKLSPDFANGMVPTLLENAPGGAGLTVSMVAATPAPRTVKLVISPEGQESFTTGTATHTATRYVVKVEIGGVAGVVAPLVGKQPPDTHVWILQGAVPTFLKSEGPLYDGGPVWRIELASPEWGKKATGHSS